MTVIAIVLTRPVFGLARLWATKTLAETQPGSIGHDVAEVLVVLV
jgi:hypothetical protein